MLIRMTSTRLGSPNGIEVQQFVAGEEYDLSGSLLKAFLAEGWCEPVRAEAPQQAAVELPEETPVVVQQPLPHRPRPRRKP